MSFLVSTTEHDIIALGHGIPSTLPEKYGADILFVTSRGLYGIQRKQFPEDFFASLRDGRLARELSMLHQLEWGMLIPEGRPKFDPDGHLLSEGNSRWTKEGLRNLMRSVKTQHWVDVEWSDDKEDTISIAYEMEKYLKKETHRSLLTRPKSHATKDEWGDVSSKDYAKFFLQGLPSIGSVRAEAIFDHFGRVPLKWDTTREEMLKVPGIGERTVDALFKSFS